MIEKCMGIGGRLFGHKFLDQYSTDGRCKRCGWIPAAILKKGDNG